MKVLVVDPDLRRAPALKDTLAAGGAEVTIASSGSFALTMLEWNRHDVVVSRARIDDMDGHELCAILKADPGTREVRFVLVAGADEVTGAETAAAGVDLVLPPSMTSGAILPLVVRLMQANRAAGSEAPSMSAPAPAPAAVATPVAASTSPLVSTAPPATVSVAREAAPAPAEAEVPRIKPAAPPPPPADPPKRYATMVTAGPDGPWGEAAPSASAPAAPLTATPAAPPRLAPPGSSPSAPPMRVAVPTAPRSPAPVRGTAPRGGSPARPAPPTGGRSGAAAPGRPAVPGSQRAAAPPPPRPAATPSVPDLASIPSGTFQGSLEVMELADLTQAISAGGKTGRLILALPQGGGLMLYEKGRIVHAEYRNTVGEEAFGALLAACHADGAGRFCFLPSPAGDSTGQPRTIDKTVDQLLLSSATAIDEKG